MGYVALSKYNWSPAGFEVLPFHPVVYPLVASFFAVALWLSLELSVQLYFKFRRHRGLYFWSILTVTCGVALHTTGLLLKLLVPGANPVVVTTMAKIGWVMDTTIFSVVLYSRLHLVVQSRKILRLVLIMIIVDAFIFHTPIIVILMGLSTGRHPKWNNYIEPFEYIQVVGFTIQETIISSIYINKTAKFLKSGYSYEIRKVMVSLVTVQVVVVLMDIAMIVIDCFGYFTLKAVMHPFSYAVKLKIEFAVLNLLLGMIKKGPSNMKIRAGSELSDETEVPPSPGPRRASVASMKSCLGMRRMSEVPVSEQIIVKKTDYDVCWLQQKQPSSTASVDSRSVTQVTPVQRPQQVAMPPNLARLDSDDTLCEGMPADDKDVNIDDLERQYLGRFGLHRLNS